jgi:hypothetical protein
MKEFSMSFVRPTGKDASQQASNQSAGGALVPSDSQEVDELGSVYGVVDEPMPLPPSYLFKVGHYMFWIGGICIGNGGQCITSIVSLMIWQYSDPIYFLGGLAAHMGWWGWIAYTVEFLIRLVVSAALAVLFQFGMALVPISTSGTWGLMLATHPDARAALQGGKKRWSILIIALLAYEVIVGLADVFSDNQAFSAITHDIRFKLVGTALLTIATLILGPAGFIIKQYAQYKMAEADLEAQEYLKQQEEEAQNNGAAKA